MPKQPKIMVFHLKEFLYTLIFLLLGAAFIVLLITMFFSDGDDSGSSEQTEPAAYTAGVYTTSITMNQSPMELEVTVDADRINSIRLIHTDEAVLAMYPLVQSSVEDLERQIVSAQSLENITCEKNAEYTYAVLLNAIRSTLNKAKQ